MEYIKKYNKKRIKVREKHSAGDAFFQIICYIIFTIFTLLCVFPFYYIFIVSISDNSLVNKGVLFLYPKGISFINYINAFKLEGFGHSTLITLARTVIGTVLTVFSSVWMGYSFSKQEFWKRNIWYKIIVVSMYFNAGLIPVYLNFRMLGILDTFWIYIVGFVCAFYIILCKTFIESLPAALEESAKLDGANYLSIFFYIIFPLSKPIVATISVFVAVGQWSSYIDTVLYIRNSELYTLQFNLYRYLNSATVLAQAMSNKGASAGIDLTKTVSTTSIKMTVAMIVSIPVLLFYPFFQRYFVKGIMVGSIKG